VLVVTPFIRPFRWSRLLWTYLIPLVPMVTLFDGLVSCLRTYSIEELRDLAARLDANDYLWDIGTVKSTSSPIPITYLIGVPNENAAEPCAAANPAGASRLQSSPSVRRVGELGSVGGLSSRRAIM